MTETNDHQARGATEMLLDFQTEVAGIFSRRTEPSGVYTAEGIDANVQILKDLRFEANDNGNQGYAMTLTGMIDLLVEHKEMLELLRSKLGLDF